MSKILLIETDEILRQMMINSLSAANYDIVRATSCDSAFNRLIDNSFDLVILNTQLGETQTGQILKRAAKTNKSFLLIDSSDSRHPPMRESQEGVYQFLQYPFTPREFMLKVKEALEHQRLVNEVEYLHHERNIIYNFDSIIGQSAKLKKIFDILRKVAGSNSTILITGETGTGKEMIAGAVHYNSPRRGNSFVTVNCAALPESLLESELFGHEKGSFTGAHKQRIGRCEQADKGTLFLDEISEMSPLTQAKMLRFIQEQEFHRVGGTKAIKVDTRIISATNKDLQEEVSKGRFREDLYYRLHVVGIHLPPLRERKEDIPLLANFFLNKYRRNLNRKITGLNDGALNLLMGHNWPGNVRELENVIERAVLMCDDEVICANDISYIGNAPGASPPVTAPNIILPAGGLSLKEVEKNLILQALERTGWVQKDAARLLQISRRVMQYKIGKYNLKSPHWPKNKE